MFPLGVLKKEQVGGGGGELINLPLTSNINDISGNSIPMSVVTGSPDFATGAMQLPSGARIRTGAADNTPIAALDLYNKLYTIEFDIKMQSAAYPTVVLYRGSADSATAQSITIDSGANTIVVSDITNNGIFVTYSLGFDSKAAFFNVKLKRTSLTSYELLINNVVVRSVSLYGSGVMDNNSSSNVYHGFRIGQAATRPFFIKNFKVVL